MRTLNPQCHNCRRNGVIGIGLLPQTTLHLILVHAHNHYQVVVPAHSTFGYLKSIVAQTFGLKPETHKLVFGGKVHEDAEDLQTAGVINNSEVLLIEDATCEQKMPEDVQQTVIASKGEEAVAEVRKVVDMLERQVSAVKAVADCGTKVNDKEIISLTEMLMRQLLKLDGIEAEGEGRVQRKMEVRRVQSLVETLDVLKSRNSNTSGNTRRIASATTQQEACNSGCRSVRSTTSPWETYHHGYESAAPWETYHHGYDYGSAAPWEMFDPGYASADGSYTPASSSVPDSMVYYSPSTFQYPTVYHPDPYYHATPHYMSHVSTPTPNYVPVAVTSSAPFSAPSYSVGSWYHQS